MSERHDAGRASSTDEATVREWTKAQMDVITAYNFDAATINPVVVDALIRSHEEYADELPAIEDLAKEQRELNARAHLPGFEEGPHLKDAEVRAAKRAQMIEAGFTPDTEGLTDDMREILREKD
jgi:hypothetical protein